MRRLKDVPPAEMPEVLRVASELYAQERAEIERADQSRELKQAAEELDLPAEYLEQAAEVVHARRVEQIRAGRRRRNGALAAVGLALALWGGWAITNRPPPAPAAYSFSAATAPQWRLEVNPESRATVTFEPGTGRQGAAAVTVQQFGLRADGRYWVNLDTTNVPASLSGYRAVTLRVRGEGLSNVRLYLEAGPTERWRSPPLSVSSDWQEHRLQLEQFDHQTRRSSSAEWRRDRYQPPGSVERLSLKLGHYVNDAAMSGRVVIDDLRFE